MQLKVAAGVGTQPLLRQAFFVNLFRKDFDFPIDGLQVPAQV